MLSNLSSANNPINENSVIQKAQNDYAEIDQRVDDLETEVAENTAALNQQGAQITSLANQVADVAANSTFDEISVNTVNSAGAAAIRIEPPLEIVRKVTAGNVCLLGTLEVDHVNFNDVRDNAASALATANSAFHTASRAEQTACNTATALNEYKDQIATSVTTCTANISGGLTVGETINANDVVSTEGHFGSIETPSIDVKEIKSSGSLELPAQMSTPNDWFTITVPNGITATFSGSYQGKKYKFTVDKGNIEYDQDVLELIKDVSFKRSDNNVRIRVKADEALTYSFTDTGAVDPISIQKSTEAYADYSYAPQKARGTIYKGFDDRTSEIQMPGIFCASVIRADEQEYVCSAAECQIISKKLFLPDEWDETGMISCTSGTDNQYVSNAIKDGCVSPTWKTPVETAVDGKLSNTHCLITEKAVSEYNGTVDDGTNVTYPITNIGDDACVHGKLTAECLCGTCCVQGKAACFQEDVQADCFNGNCLIVCDIYGKAPVGDTSKVIVHDDTEFMNTTTFDENSCFKKKIVVDCDADFGEDVHIAGDLYVNGVSHVVDEETIETPSNEIMLRQNATTGLANTEISGILINKYNGTDSLTVGTDNTGTLRVGTGTGTSTSYATICHNQTENKWYVSDTEVTPAGVLQSYATKVEEDPYTVYTDAVFIAIDKTSLEPVLTRDEEVDMTQCGITYWDATNTKAKTASKIKYNNNGLDFDGKTCIEATQTTITDGTDTTTIDATKVESKCGCFTDACVECTITSDITCACTCVDTPLAIADCVKSRGNGEIEGNFLICGSLSVCGQTAITGLMSDCIATTETSVDADYYIPMVEKNHQTQGANTVCTDGAFKYNPFSNTLTAENADFTDTVSITCNCVENECVNNLCVGTVVTNADATKSAVYCVTNVTGNTDFAIPLYNKDVTNVNSTKKAELSYANQATGPRYNPSTYTLCVCCARAKEFIADNAVVVHRVVSCLDVDLAAGSSQSIVLDARCRNSSGTLTNHYTTFCGTDGKIYNDYGFVGPNNYHNCVAQADGGTNYFEVVPRDNTSSNRSIHLDFTIYNANYSINLFYCSCGCWAVRSFDDNRSVYEQAQSCNPYGKLGFSEGDDKKHLFFCYTGYSAMTIDGDQQFTVNMCSSNPTSCNYRNSYSRIACGAECLYDYADHGWVERYNGLLRGAWCIEATGGQVTIAHDCDNNKYGCIGALTNGIISVQKCGYMNPFYPGDAINWMYRNWADISDIVTVRGFQSLSYDYLPAYASKTCCSNYTYNRGFLISGGTITCSNGCCLGGYVFGLVGQCDSDKNWYSLPRAVYGYRNICCKDCVVQSGVWCDNKLYELIDERGGQTINGGLTLHNSGNTSYLYADGICVKDTAALTSCDNIVISPSYDNFMVQNPQLYKSFIGSSEGGVQGTEWYNVISIRHRNGYGDGTLWGSEIFQPMTTAGHWSYQQQFNGSWTAANQFIDSTGGQTINGNLTLHNSSNNATLTADCFKGNFCGCINFNDVADANLIIIDPNVCHVTRKVYYYTAFDQQGFYQRFALGMCRNFANDGWGAALLSVGHDDAGTVWEDFKFDTGGYITAPGGYHTSSGLTLDATANYPISLTCGDQHILLSSTYSISIGNLSSAAQTSVAIGACSNALTGNSVAIGTCSCSQTYAVAIGCDAKATYYSVSIGCAANSCSSYGVAIGNGAKNCVQNGIAIGAGANTSAYSSACVLVDERAGSRMRRSIICWNGGTKQCDLFCAIYCRFNFNYYDDSGTIYFSVTGQYGCTDVSEIRWDCGESPKNIDFYKDGGSRFTVYDGCTCTIPKAGWVQIINYAR